MKEFLGDVLSFACIERRRPSEGKVIHKTTSIGPTEGWAGDKYAETLGNALEHGFPIAVRHKLFREYWESLGCPSLEMHNRNDSGGWRACVTSFWSDDCDYRIAGDVNWELRLKWVNSGKVLLVEQFDPAIEEWGPAAAPSWSAGRSYRLKPTEGAEWEITRTPPSMEAVKVDTNKAMRFNKGKVPLSFLLDAPIAVRGLCRVFSFGAKKYARDNWKKGLDRDELIDSLLRHLLAFKAGEDFDDAPGESGEHHLFLALWNALILAEQHSKEKK